MGKKTEPSLINFMLGKVKTPRVQTRNRQTHHLKPGSVLTFGARHPNFITWRSMESGTAAQMAEGGVPEGPHKVLVLEHTLDYILSFLDGESLKAARTVCRNWNDRVLENFHKGLKLNGVDDDRNRDLSSFSLDQRMLSSIFIPSSCTERMLRTAFEQLGSAGKLQELKFLGLGRPDEKALNYLINVANNGELGSLEELDLNVNFNFSLDEEDDDYENRMKKVSPGVLPRLKALTLSADFEDYMEVEDEEAGLMNDGFHSKMQSFLSAAPNLETLKANTSLELSGLMNLKKLDLELQEEANPVLMIRGVRESLRTLRVVNLTALNDEEPLPVLPNLRTLVFLNEGDKFSVGEEESISLNSLPELRSLEITYDCIHCENFPSLFPPTGKLRKIKVLEVPVPERKDRDFMSLVMPFKILLSARVDNLVLKFKKFGVLRLCQLLRLLDLLDLEEEKTGLLERTESVLELRVGRIVDTYDEYTDSSIRNFSAILEKLGDRWGLVELQDYKFSKRGGPTWTEKEVPLFGGKKKGVIKLRKSPRMEDFWVVTLQMEESDLPFQHKNEFGCSLV